MKACSPWRYLMDKWSDEWSQVQRTEAKKKKGLKCYLLSERKRHFVPFSLLETPKQFRGVFWPVFHTTSCHKEYLIGVMVCFNESQYVKWQYNNILMENCIILKRDKSRAGSCLSQLCCRVDKETQTHKCSVPPCTSLQVMLADLLLMLLPI